MPEQLATEATAPTAEPEPLADHDTDTDTDTDTEPTPGEPTAEDSSERDDAEDTDQGDVTKARRDAAKYRARLRETESERDQLRDQLATQRRALIDWRAANAPTAVDAALLDAAGIQVDDLLDDSGHLDMAAVDEFIDATAKRFRIASGFRPNRAQGHAGLGGVAPKSTLADVFRR